MNLLEVGSFATIWLLLWLAMASILVIAYPLIRPFIFKFEASYGGNIVLGLISLPMIFSLLSTTLLFFPYAEHLFVEQHCHANCDEHLPLLNSTLIAWPGLAAMAIVLLLFSVNAVRQIVKVRRLSRHLSRLSENTNEQPFKLLLNDTPIVFTVGLLRSTIYLSEGLRKSCTDEELNIVLAHEKAHVLRRDNFRILSAKLLTSFFPQKLISTIYEDFLLLIESACDIYAAKLFGNIRVAETFLKIQKLVPNQSNLPTGVSSINGSEIEFRIKSLIQDSERYQPSKFVSILTFSTVLVLLIACIDPLHHLIEWLLVGY